MKLQCVNCITKDPNSGYNCTLYLDGSFVCNVCYWYHLKSQDRKGIYYVGSTRASAKSLLDEDTRNLGKTL